jgi:hypothetical protein
MTFEKFFENTPDILLKTNNVLNAVAKCRITVIINLSPTDVSPRRNLAISR